MTKKQLQELIDLHETRLKRVDNMLKNFYWDIEANDEHHYWVDQMKREKEIIEGLKNEKPDD